MGSGTYFSPPCITTGVHEYQGTPIHTDDSGISHLLREETRLGRLGKTQARFEISQMNEVTETHPKRW